MEIRTLFQISICKTLYLNYHYFGFQGLLRLPVIASRNLKIAKAKGKISVSGKRASVLLGFGNPGITDRRYQRSIFEVGGVN